MPSLAWDDCCRRAPPRNRWLDRLPLPDRIDVKFLGAFDPHFVAENAVNDRGCRMIRNFGAIPVIGVGLSPHSSIFQTNHRPAGKSVKLAVHTTYKQIHLGVGLCGSFRCSFLFSGLLSRRAIALKPGIELLQLVSGELTQSRGTEFC